MLLAIASSILLSASNGLIECFHHQLKISLITHPNVNTVDRLSNLLYYLVSAPNFVIYILLQLS